MKDWLRGPRGGLLAFVIITALVAGALGWATAAALRVEREQLIERAEAEHAARVRLALWRLDSRIAPLLARERNRPFDHYSAIFAPPLAFNNRGACVTPGAVLEPSPLLGTELPDWILLHFQINSSNGWESPQVPSISLLRRLTDPHFSASLPNVTAARRCLLAELSRSLPSTELLAIARSRTEPATLRDVTLMVAGQQVNPSGLPNTFNSNLDKQPQQGQPNGFPPMNESQQDVGNPQRFNNPTGNSVYSQSQLPGQGNNEYNMRSAFQSRIQEESLKQAQRIPRDQILKNYAGNGEKWLVGESKGPPPPPAPAKKDSKVVVSAEAIVNLSPMVPLWVETAQGTEYLMLLRMVSIEEKETCQGLVLDGARLQELLLVEAMVAELFPEAQLVPVREPVPAQLERTMTALPFQLDPGPVPQPADPGWTPLRVGLSMAWAAAGIALLAVALGGWSLMDLSERRIRFVSAVTHELRTPLTTLRLYVDMLLGGLVRDDRQREEYLQTLNAEAERLNRLVSNVLDFSRLEKRGPNLMRVEVPLPELLTQVHATWSGRCQDAGKELLIENTLAPDMRLCTDPELLQQVLGNLLDNACKYSRGADDPRLWLRVKAEQGYVVFEVEDRGPGVPTGEQRSIFRAFRRGRQADVTAGGVGLGLALAHRWARLLGGRLTLRAPGTETGACFRVCLPVR